MNTITIFFAFILAGGAMHSQAPSNPSFVDLYRNFVTPPAEAKPRTWWHWTGGNITREGITKDLGWMARVGIGGFMLFDVSLGMGQQVDDIPQTVAFYEHFGFKTVCRTAVDSMVSPIRSYTWNANLR